MRRPPTVSVKLQPTEEFLCYVLTSICESSPDTASWATASKIDRRAVDGLVCSMHVSFDTESSDEGSRTGRGVLGFHAIARGISVALVEPELDPRIRGAIMAAVATNDSGGDFDGTCADVIAQCALLGKVVYG